MALYLRLTSDLPFRPSLRSHLFLVIPLVSVPGCVCRNLHYLPQGPTWHFVLPETSLDHNILETLDFLTSSVLYAHIRRSTSSNIAVPALLVLLAAAGAYPHDFVVAVPSCVADNVGVAVAATAVGIGVRSVAVGIVVAQSRRETVYRRVGIVVCTVDCSTDLRMLTVGSVALAVAVVVVVGVAAPAVSQLSTFPTPSLIQVLSVANAMFAAPDTSDCSHTGCLCSCRGTVVCRHVGIASYIVLVESN